MTTLFTRDDLIDGLRDLVRELRVAGQPTGLRIIGGCALALRHYERQTTVDIDALRVNPGVPIGPGATPTTSESCSPSARSRLSRRRTTSTASSSRAIPSPIERGEWSSGYSLRAHR
ncbi:hypothetical protein [Agromyces sp. Soil535]|uniref:hypothetical protein n=1 Tax=Agromyces sp. Soil535 TaxID=1736390 RepID=UPI0012E3A056|nr:hypothetical protein [Agromyces sp. Soil535]